MYMNVISCWMYSSFHLRARLVYLASCCSCWWRHLAWVPVVGQIKEESVKVGGDEQHPAKETSLYYLLPMPWTPFSTLLCRLLSWRRKQQNIEQSREGKPRIEVQVQTLIFLGCKRVNQTKPAAGKEELRNIRCLPPLHCADSWSSSANSLFSSGCKRVNQTKPAAGKEELRNFRYLPPLHCERDLLFCTLVMVPRRVPLGDTEYKGTSVALVAKVHITRVSSKLAGITWAELNLLSVLEGQILEGQSVIGR